MKQILLGLPLSQKNEKEFTYQWSDLGKHLWNCYTGHELDFPDLSQDQCQYIIIARIEKVL